MTMDELPKKDPAVETPPVNPLEITPPPVKPAAQATTPPDEIGKSPLPPPVQEKENAQGGIMTKVNNAAFWGMVGSVCIWAISKVLQ